MSTHIIRVTPSETPAIRRAYLRYRAYRYIVRPVGRFMVCFYQCAIFTVVGLVAIIGGLYSIARFCGFHTLG